MTSTPFKLGELYAHDFIMKTLKVGNSGGIRIATTRMAKVARIVLFSTSEQESNPQENPYQDRANGAVLTYTGTGKIGNQNLSGQNLRITQQSADFFQSMSFPFLVIGNHQDRQKRDGDSPESINISIIHEKTRLTYWEQIVVRGYLNYFG